MKGRGRCGRRNREKVKTEEERLGGSPDRDSNWSRCREQWLMVENKDLRKGAGGSLVVRSDRF